VLHHRPIEQYLAAFTAEQPDGSSVVPPEIVAGRLPDVSVLDVREPEECEHDLGYIPGSLQIDPAVWGEGDHDHGSRAMVFVCDDGHRSQQLSARMASEGRRIPALLGGVRRWVQLGFRIEHAQIPRVRWGRNELMRVFLALSKAPPAHAATIFRSLAAANRVVYSEPTPGELRLMREAIVQLAVQLGIHAARPEAMLAEFDRRFPPIRGPRPQPVLDKSITAPGEASPLVPPPRWR